ncbi:hypothetical protein QJS04_geneDACA016377 [Acorus gramineus]|uniref:Myb/SANT-like DNA-binding domain-containing protein n=1 Tax=Acorus gramineus TaxID=55184 RepID=A0AAV9ASD0_ACOGR|nr:hypothetical protein QJS04_geneDACA016377 [Acorus gramineus]
MDDQAICGAGNDSGLLYHHHHHQLIGDPVADPFPQTIRGNPANLATTSDDDEDGQTLTNPSKKSSPWQRMKWTDEVVRLLINVVAFVDANEVPPSASSAAGGGGKKGKWKTVSKLMMERSCFVSPQQCEDKFNDLNKRYKRLNEILGRGTTCDVVEDPSLLDSMHHVPVKAKEDVRRILGSKHLFYREMCAYHNGQKIPNSQNLERHEFSDDDDVGESEEEEEEEEKELKEVEGGGGDNEVVEGAGREWLRKRELELMEEGVGLRMDMFELEKRRLKWRRFVGKKDREMERLRLENERSRLENERMLLRVRKRELELNRIKCTDEGL